MNKKIIIIGSGFGGLGAACRLAARGHDVEIFEKRDKPGGRAYVYEINGFKFDGGPTIITAQPLQDCNAASKASTTAASGSITIIMTDFFACSLQGTESTNLYPSVARRATWETIWLTVFMPE